MADFLGTIHHEFTFTVEEGIDALYDLIWHIESYEQVGWALMERMLAASAEVVALWGAGFWRCMVGSWQGRLGKDVGSL